MSFFRIHFALITLGIALTGCTRELSECNGPQMNMDAIASAQSIATTSGPKANLVLPNPIDAGKTSSNLSSSISGFTGLGLGGLLDSSKLENSFLKVRSGTIQESGDLARPNSKGEYSFELQDVRYAQTMAYHAISSVQSYVNALGFSVDKSRPLYVLVRSKDDPNDASSNLDNSFANAYYQHNKDNPSQPRLIQVFGGGEYALSMDRDTYWHEFGHLFNESLTRDVGMDEATVAGASFVQSRSIHECLADYLSESVGNKDYIGKWGAHNYPDIPAGEPIRSAGNKKDDKNNYSKVAFSDGNESPENYALAEWCTRVLWDVRTQFTKEDPNKGSYVSDRLLFSALSLVGKDASLREFQQAIVQADEELHCGLHQRSIQNAFSSRGYPLEQDSISQPLSLTVSAVGVEEVSGAYQIGKPSVKSVEIFHPFKISNPNGGVARNVRIKITSSDAGVVPLIYLQGYGDIAAGKSVAVGSDSVDTLLKSVSLVADKAKVTNGRLKYQIQVLVENGPTTTKNMELAL